MTFETLIKQIKNGKTFERICNEQDYTLVECDGNAVYYDDDLVDFLKRIGAEIVGFSIFYATIKTRSGEIYKIPYDEIENRFDDELDNEIILMF